MLSLAPVFHFNEEDELDDRRPVRTHGKSIMQDLLSVVDDFNSINLRYISTKTKYFEKSKYHNRYLKDAKDFR